MVARDNTPPPKLRKLSVVVPVFNERNTLVEILRRMRMVELPDGIEREIIVIDDGSDDGTRDVLKQLGDSTVRVIMHEHNRGKGAAVRTGFEHATGDKYGNSRVFDTPISRGWHRRRGGGHGRLRAATRGRDPVRRLFLSGIGPDRVRSRPPALPLRGRIYRTADAAHAVRRRDLRRPDAQPEPGGAVHARVRHTYRDAVEPLRRQGPPDLVHRERRPGHLSRAQAALQRSVRRPSRPAHRAMVEASARRRAGRVLHRAAGIGEDIPSRRRPHRACLRDDGVRVARRPRASPASMPRSSTCAASGRSTSTRSSAR